MTTLDVRAVGAHLARRGIALRGELSATLIAGGRSNLTYLLTDGESDWVLRRPPTAGLTPSAHDMGREYRVMDALCDTVVPVPETVTFCDDVDVIGAPFSVVAHVDGTVIRSADDLSALSDEAVEARCRALVQALAALHAVDPAAGGLDTLGRADGYLARQVSLWSRQWAQVASAPSPDVESLAGWLAEHLPEQSDSVVVHGDYRIDNVLFDADGGIAAILDWEMSTLGDPLSDVALMCAYRNPAMDLILGFPAAWTSPRLPDAAAIADLYAQASGRALQNWDFYLGLAHFKLAVIAAGIDHRFRNGATTGAGFDNAGDSVGEFACAGMQIVLAGSRS